MSDRRVQQPPNKRPSPGQVAARLYEVEKEYNRKARKVKTVKRKKGFPEIRLNEIERIVRDFTGGLPYLPNDDAGADIRLVEMIR